MFGVCTSLGLGVIQLNNGINRINTDISESVDNQTIIIWCVTALATISVISGIKVGIRRLSEICFGIGMYNKNEKWRKGKKNHKTNILGKYLSSLSPLFLNFVIEKEYFNANNWYEIKRTVFFFVHEWKFSVTREFLETRVVCFVLKLFD